MTGATPFKAQKNVTDVLLKKTLSLRISPKSLYRYREKEEGRRKDDGGPTRIWD